MSYRKLSISDIGLNSTASMPWRIHSEKEKGISDIPVDVNWVRACVNTGHTEDLVLPHVKFVLVSFQPLHT